MGSHQPIVAQIMLGGLGLEWRASEVHQPGPPGRTKTPSAVTERPLVQGTTDGRRSASVDHCGRSLRLAATHCQLQPILCRAIEGCVPDWTSAYLNSVKMRCTLSRGLTVGVMEQCGISSRWEQDKAEAEPLIRRQHPHP